mgnify:CR=1 FL=1
MNCNKELPLVGINRLIRMRRLLGVDVDTLGFHHDQAGIDPFNLSTKLLFRYWFDMYLNVSYGITRVHTPVGFRLDGNITTTQVVSDL